MEQDEMKIRKEDFEVLEDILNKKVSPQNPYLEVSRKSLNLAKKLHEGSIFFVPVESLIDEVNDSLTEMEEQLKTKNGEVYLLMVVTSVYPAILVENKEDFEEEIVKKAARALLPIYRVEYRFSGLEEKLEKKIKTIVKKERKALENYYDEILEERKEVILKRDSFYEMVNSIMNAIQEYSGNYKYLEKQSELANTGWLDHLRLWTFMSVVNEGLGFPDPIEAGTEELEEIKRVFREYVLSNLRGLIIGYIGTPKEPKKPYAPLQENFLPYFLKKVKSDEARVVRWISFGLLLMTYLPYVDIISFRSKFKTYYSRLESRINNVCESFKKEIWPKIREIYNELPKEGKGEEIRKIISELYDEIRMRIGEAKPRVGAPIPYHQ